MSYMYKQPAVKKTEPSTTALGKKPAVGSTGTASTATAAKPAPTSSTTSKAAAPAPAPDKKPAASTSSNTANTTTKTTTPAATTATSAKPAANGTVNSTSPASTATKADTKPDNNKPTTVGTTTKTAFASSNSESAKPTADQSTTSTKSTLTPAAAEKSGTDKEKDTSNSNKASADDAASKPSAPSGRKGSTRAENKPRFRYDYHKLFDAREYRNTFYDFSHVTTADEQLNAEHNPLGFIIRTQYAFLKEINKTLTKVEKKKKDEIIMLDIGTGPSIVPACLGTVFDIGTVICSDFTPACRTLLQLWWWGREDSFDWQPVTKYISTLAATEKKPVEDPLIFEERARLKLQAIFSCDVEQANVLSPNQLDQCDILTSTLAFECAASDTEEFEAIIERCNNSIRINGYILFAGALNETWYKTSVDSEIKFKVQPVTEEDIRRGLKYAGFDNVDIRTLPYTQQQHGNLLKLCDASGIYVVRAQKVKAMEYDQEE